MILKNTDNTYIIDVRNSQTIDGVTDEIRERARGRYYERGGKKYILYKSSDEGAEYSSVIIVSQDRVTIKRNGGVTSAMVLDVKKPTRSIYTMPYGKIGMELETDLIASCLTENGGELRLKYTLTIQGGKYYNDMTINVTEEIL